MYLNHYVKNCAIIGLLIIGCAACRDEEPANLCLDNTATTITPCISELPVATEECIIQEIKVVLHNGNELSKYVYHHNGTHYHQIDHYLVKEDGFSETPDEIIQLEYDGQGRATNVFLTKPSVAGHSMATTYEYDETVVRISFRLSSEGAEDHVEHWEQLYVPDPKDSIYQFEQPPVPGVNNRFLFEFKGGNRVRFGIPEPDGPCSIYGERWRFTTKAHYDRLPNTIKDHAVRYPFNGAHGIPGFNEQFWVQEAANNFVAFEHLDDGSEPPFLYCWTFLISPGNERWIKEFKGTESSLIYTYNCE